MRWFRRSSEDWEEKDWSFNDGLLRPSFPYVVPEPWRDNEDSDVYYQLPVAFAQIFAQRSKIVNIKRNEAPYISELIESIRSDGLREPVTMYVDSAGHIRYHDGYHRLTAICEIPEFVTLPVVIKFIPKGKGGRHISEEILKVLDLVQSPSTRFY